MKPFARTLPSHSPRYSKPLLNLLTGTMVRSLGLYEIATFKTNEFHHYPYNFNSWERPSFRGHPLAANNCCSPLFEIR